MPSKLWPESNLSWLSLVSMIGTATGSALTAASNGSGFALAVAIGAGILGLIAAADIIRTRVIRRRTREAPSDPTEGQRPA